LPLDVARMPSHTFKSWLKTFFAAPITVNRRERLRACCGALIAIVLTAIITQHLPGYWSDMPWLIAPMGASAVLLFAVPASTNAAQLGFTSADLDLALQDYNETLDVDRGDLEIILRQAESNAYRRRFGEVTCADVMTTSIVTVVFGDLLEDAWQLMQKHRVKALPVVDRSSRVVGMITQSDLILALYNQRLREAVAS